MSVLKKDKTGVSSKAYPIFSRIKGLKEVKTMLSSLKRFYRDEVAQKRLRIVKFYRRRSTPVHLRGEIR